MPELPEVEAARQLARRAVQGRTIAGIDVRHPAQRRALPHAATRSLRGDRITGIDRRAKYQVIRLASGRTLTVHFRLSGDWVVLQRDDEAPDHARVVIRFTDGRALALVDPRALASMVLAEKDVDPLPALGPEATDAAFDGAFLKARAARRRGPIKVLLLDQRVVGGVGNIYASEALWLARIDPRRAANRLTSAECTRVVAGVRRVMKKALAHPARYYDSAASHLRFNVYDREGKGCRRCRTPIARFTQAARSTYWCPRCQGVSPSPRAPRP